MESNGIEIQSRSQLTTPPSMRHPHFTFSFSLTFNSQIVQRAASRTTLYGRLIRALVFPR